MLNKVFDRTYPLCFILGDQIRPCIMYHNVHNNTVKYHKLKYIANMKLVQIYYSVLNAIKYALNAILIFIELLLTIECYVSDARKVHAA